MEPINFQHRKSQKALQLSKAEAIASLRQAADILLQASAEVEAGTITREVDDLMLEVADALVPLEQFFIDELKPEYFAPEPGNG